MKDEFLFDITQDDLARFDGRGPAFVTFGEVMVRDTPADSERPERTRLVHLSLAGSEYSVAIGLSRLGIPTSYITRVPDNPYGRAVCNTARENGVSTEHFVWARPAEPIGRYLYELGRTPRPGAGFYQRMFSAASRLGSGMVDWGVALKDAKLFHTTGITFGLAAHSGYPHNHLLEAFTEAMQHKPTDCLVGMDFNYRSTLWSFETARDTLNAIMTEHVDVLITSVYDMARFFNIPCGQYSVEQVLQGNLGPLQDDDLRAFGQKVHRQFGTRILAVTRRYPDSFEQQRWESAAVTADGQLFRSPAIRSMALLDSLGGGDAWVTGFFYGLLTAGLDGRGIAKGVLVGDAATRLQQTLMFDLPIIDRHEVQALMQSDASGGGKRTVR
jgi:2-dehydro-3-deoxygluconokinase